MKLTTLNECKAHSRIEINDEDSLLQVYADAAEEFVLNVLERTADELIDMYGQIPASIKQAVWMMFANSYTQRQPAAMSNYYAVPYTFDALIKPYMSL